MTTVDIRGLSKAEVLRALYNRAQPLGMGFLHYSPEAMTEPDAAALLRGAQGDPPYFDYLRGRVMKVRLTDDEIDVRLYDRDNGEGAAAEAIAALRVSSVSDSTKLAAG